MFIAAAPALLGRSLVPNQDQYDGAYMRVTAAPVAMMTAYART
jgi:hypothetical protein